MFKLFGPESEPIGRPAKGNMPAAHSGKSSQKTQQNDDYSGFITLRLVTIKSINCRLFSLG